MLAQPGELLVHIPTPATLMHCRKEFVAKMRTRKYVENVWGGEMLLRRRDATRPTTEDALLRD